MTKTNEALYPPDTLDKIKNAKVGRPSKKPEQIFNILSKTT
jgi:hypothetical protein